MSQILTSAVSQIFPLAKEYGYKRILTVVSLVSFYMFAFVFWAEIYLFLGKDIFWLPWHWSLILGVFSIIVLILSLLFGYTVASESFRATEFIMQKMQDPSIDEKERASIAKSYSHLPFIRMLSAPGLVSTLVGFFVVNILASFGLMVLFVNNINLLAQVLNTFLSELVPWVLWFPQISIPPITLLLGLLILSFYSYEFLFAQIRMVKTNRVRMELGVGAFLQVGFYVSLPMRLLLFALCLTLAYCSRRDRLTEAGFQPFLGCLDVSRIAKKAFINVQGKECIISEYKCKIETEKDMQDLKKQIDKFLLESGGVPILNGTIDFTQANREILTAIARLDPIFYAGLVEGQCAFIGIKYFNIAQNARGAVFYFRNKHVLNEFIAIMSEEVKKSRQL